MARRSDQLEADKAVRNEARRAFDSRFAQVRQDLDARGVGGRITDKLGEDARDMLSEAKDIAAESKGVIAGTIAALALWFFREPIIAWLDDRLEFDKLLGLLGHEDEADSEGESGSE